MFNRGLVDYISVEYLIELQESHRYQTQRKKLLVLCHKIY